MRDIGNREFSLGRDQNTERTQAVNCVVQIVDDMGTHAGPMCHGVVEGQLASRTCLPARDPIPPFGKRRYQRQSGPDVLHRGKLTGLRNRYRAAPVVSVSHTTSLMATPDIEL